MIQVYIDTNVFLDFYQSATDRMAIFHELLDRPDCIVVPEQTVREVRRNRSAMTNRASADRPAAVTSLRLRVTIERRLSSSALLGRTRVTRLSARSFAQLILIA